MNQFDIQPSQMPELFVVLFLIAVIVVGIAYFCAQKNAMVSLVMEKSTALRNLQNCNLEYRLKFDMDLQSEYLCYHAVSSKAAFDRADFREILIEYLSPSIDFFLMNINKAKKNTQLYQSYLQRCKLIYDCRDRSWCKSDYLKNIELDMFNRKKLCPPCSFAVKIHISYSSPHGKKYYSDFKVYNIAELEEAIQVIKTRNSFQESKKHERFKMSDSLRYDVMKRDGFKCRICGRGADDGVKLHVDHIRPIAQGGKTEMSNLRTLCSECNLGKRDKYDPYGGN